MSRNRRYRGKLKSFGTPSNKKAGEFETPA